MKNKTLLLLLTLCALNVSAQKKHIAFINATAHIGNGQVIENAIFAINGPSIEMIADIKGIRLNPNAYDTVIDLQGQHLYPGLINTNNVLGLHDAEAVRATVDFAEVGALNSHVRALIAYNTDNIIIPTVRCNGVAYTQVCPRGNLISGSSSVMSLNGWNWEDAVLKADDGIHVNFPRLPARKYDDEKINKDISKQYNAEIENLLRFFTDARAYCKQTNPIETNLRFEAMRAVFNGSARLYLHADRAKDILAAISFAQSYTIAHPVIVGGKDAWQVTEALAKNKVPVMLNRINDLPDRADDDVDLVFRIPAMLQKDSVLFCLQLEGDMEAMHSRNLPYNAGVAVGYGLSKEQALSAITLNAAKILGLEKQIGSLEDGKMASFVISSGDLLDMKSSTIVAVYINGKKVVLENKQTELYNTYQSKYGIK